ncbi:MAG TPA: VacB/RNase II family 3'-5' exoribonuclease [Acidisarcina sp.]
MTDRDLIHRIERSAGHRAGYKQLVRELGLGGGRERRQLLEQLERLTSRGQLVKLDRDHWSLPRAAVSTRDNLAAGRLDLHRDGYGFVRPEVKQASGNDDIFIPPNELAGAMQGDQVLVELSPPRSDGRRLGRIVRVLSRRNPTVVGIFHYAGERYDGRGVKEEGNIVVPFDERMTQPILIPPGMEVPSVLATPHRVLGEEAAAAQRFDSLEGLVVDVEITDWPTITRPARGRVIEVLGEEDAFGVDVEMVIRKHHLPHIFPANVLAEAASVAHLDLDEVAERRDFRSLSIVTIDGETARDFDDAILVEEQADGITELQVHIADVAAYVTPGTDLDLEARLRGNSVYFPDRAIPMLPQELSTGICSLRPGEDRLVLSCIMQIDAEGDVLSYEICEGVIRSARRMTYTQVHAILDGDAATREQFADLVPSFERMYELAQRLNKKRQRRGSIDFDLPEPIIEFDKQGVMQGVVRSQRSWANRLIEEFMLSANECVATWLEQLGVPSIYRIHEKPDARRVVEFEEIAVGFGYSLGLGSLPVKKMQMKADRRDHQRRSERGASSRSAPRQHEIAEEMPITPRMYQRLTAKIAGKPEERILAYLMLRSLKQARYSEKNEGHFALAAPSYTHFTSPIRRYPDLIVHRLLKAVLHAGVEGAGELTSSDLHAPENSPWKEAHERPRPRPARPSEFLRANEPPVPLEELAAIAQECSRTERRAAEAERELVEWKKIKFMKDRVGEDFDAMILSATRYGLFVELDNLFVEGLVPLDSLRDDRYTYRESTRQIIGDRSGRKYTMGERVRVVLDRIDAVQRRLQFSILEPVSAPGPKRAKKDSASAKLDSAQSPADETSAPAAGAPASKKLRTNSGSRRIPSPPRSARNRKAKARLRNKKDKGRKHK